MSNSNVTTNPKKLYLHVGGVEWKGIDFGPLLAAGVALTGAPTIGTIATGLSAASEEVNSTAFYDADPNVAPIAADEGVIALFTATTAGEYTFTVSCGTDDGQTLVVSTTFVVEEPA